jgi:hypothetical protein
VDESILSSMKDKLQYQLEKSDQDLDEWLRKHYNGLITRYSNKRDDNKTFLELPRVEYVITALHWSSKTHLYRRTMTVLASAPGSEIALIPVRSLDHTIDMLNKM